MTRSTRQFSTGGAPHVPAPTSVQMVMRRTLLALLPGIAANVWFFGPGILVQLIIAITAALAFEAIMLKLRRRSLRVFLTDLSAPLTAILYCLCLPPLMPWWAAVIGMLFAIVIAKHLYGGLGYNVFNPAMVGFVVILVCFPLHASSWPAPMTNGAGLVDSIRIIFSGVAPGSAAWDAVTEATPLDLIRTGAAQGQMMSEVIQHPAFGEVAGRGRTWLALAYAVGGLYLLNRRIISWHVPVGVLGLTLLLTLPVYLFDPDTNPSPLVHLLSGGLILGAFFIATDPVSGSSTPRGRLLFGAGVALITLIIRRWGAYPDGVAFAVLLMNMAVPIIDRYTKPRVFGHGDKP